MNPTKFSSAPLTAMVLTIALLWMDASMPSQAQTASPTPAAQITTANQTSNAQPQLQQRYPRYIIQRSDVLLLTFPLSPELNQTVTVQPDGFVNLQTAGSVHIQGMTVPEVMEAVKKAYTGILNSPIVNVDLEDYQKPFFTVSGQVGKPGQYDLRTETPWPRLSLLLEACRPQLRLRFCCFIAPQRIGSK